jgi:hypothetical protein
MESDLALPKELLDNQSSRREVGTVGMSTEQPIAEPRARRGFRLVDLVIMIAMLIMVVAIASPWIQRMRYTQDCVRCNGYLMWLGLSCHNANDVYGSMPPFKAPGDADPKSYLGTPGNHGTLFLFLLPFMEGDDLYKGAALTTSTGATAHDVDVTLGSGKSWKPPLAPFAGEKPLRSLQCPVDPSMPAGGQIGADPENYGAVQSWGACSYACNYLVFGNAKCIERGELDNPDGYDSRRKPPAIAPSTCPRVSSSFPDGISNTILFAEKMAQCQWTRGGMWAPQPGGTLWAPAVDNAQWAPAFAMESPWHDGTTFQLRPTPSQCNAVYPSAGHYDRLAVAMADGSARQISPKICSETFYALCTPNGGEIIGPDF